MQAVDKYDLSSSLLLTSLLKKVHFIWKVRLSLMLSINLLICLSFNIRANYLNATGVVYLVLRTFALTMALVSIGVATVSNRVLA